MSRDDGRWVVVGWLGSVASVVDSQGVLPVEVAHDGGDRSLLVRWGYVRYGGATMLLICFLASVGDLNMSYVIESLLA